MGTIHAIHRTGTDYSLEVLKTAISKAAPDVILTEIPPDRAVRALQSFRDTGEITEPRTRVFPEYTDVVFPLSREMGFRILGTSGWTQEIADNRAAALRRIRSDPGRARQWAEHLAAQREYTRALSGRGDDPRFIHTDEFDSLTAASRQPYQQYFDADLGPGGWTQINRAHNDLIHAALDKVTGKGLSVLVTFGTAHKYMILRSLSARRDLALQETRALFVHAP
ncbi:hypothetical protein [Qipengyuania sp. ASV99]|uniref:hypothetical protein n=1 Tax=Qipengyuania sp. ASV99 TaxID=3399681 RepID=UPI003A4C6939